MKGERFDKIIPSRVSLFGTSPRQFKIKKTYLHIQIAFKYKSTLVFIFIVISEPQKDIIDFHIAKSEGSCRCVLTYSKLKTQVKNHVGGSYTASGGLIIRRP